MKTTPACLLAGILMSSALASADALPMQLEACAAMRHDSERLMCYDKAVAQIRSGADVPAPSPENMFGANTEVLGAKAHRGDVKREELTQISGSVTSLRLARDGMILLELDNGQVWRQQDVDVRLLISLGDKVTIERALLGTFRITDKSGRFARFKRVR